NKNELKINMGMDRVSITIPQEENNYEYGYGEKEKEKQKEKEKEKQKEEEEEITYSVGRFKKLYEQNIGLVNGIVAEWLFEVSELDRKSTRLNSSHVSISYAVFCLKKKKKKKNIRRHKDTSRNKH